MPNHNNSSDLDHSIDDAFQDLSFQGLSFSATPPQNKDDVTETDESEFSTPSIPSPAISNFSSTHQPMVCLPSVMNVHRSVLNPKTTASLQLQLG